MEYEKRGKESKEEMEDKEIRVKLMASKIPSELMKSNRFILLYSNTRDHDKCMSDMIDCMRNGKRLDAPVDIVVYPKTVRVPEEFTKPLSDCTIHYRNSMKSAVEHIHHLTGDIQQRANLNK